MEHARRRTELSMLLSSEDAGLADRIRTLLPDLEPEVRLLADLGNVPTNSRPPDVAIISSRACRRWGTTIEAVLESLSRRGVSAECIYLTDPGGLVDLGSTGRREFFRYAMEPVSDEELRLLMRSVVERHPRPRSPSSSGAPEGLEGLIGRSLPMQAVYRQLEQAARTDVLVLLLGETGTGKDLAAQAIHRLSPRRNGPFVAVNLGALPKELVASELFGHDKGAFTGAIREHRGKIEQAANGTIFLDDIDAIDEKMQVSLLRVIEQKTFQRLGGEVKIKANARMLVATNQNLERLVREGRFREDLFYRLDVFRIAMPPLSERRGDLQLLSERFLDQFARASAKHIMGISVEALERIEAYSWPGNVRELKNVIQRAVLVSDGPEILARHLPAKFHGGGGSPSLLTFEVGTPLEQVEREMILKTLAACNNNRTDAARLLGISRRSMYTRLKRHGID